VGQESNRQPAVLGFQAIRLITSHSTRRIFPRSYRVQSGSLYCSRFSCHRRMMNCLIHRMKRSRPQWARPFASHASIDTSTTQQATRSLSPPTASFGDRHSSWMAWWWESAPARGWHASPSTRCRAVRSAVTAPRILAHRINQDLNASCTSPVSKRQLRLGARVSSHWHVAVGPTPI
jgi:hypothetical protein